MTKMLRVAAAVLLIGCVDSRGGGGGGGGGGDADGGPDDRPSTCVQACYAQLENGCYSSGACESTCATAAALSTRIGCAAEHDAVFECYLENSHACGTDLAILCSDEEEALAACSLRFCDEDPTDAYCVENCVTLCENLQDACWTDYNCRTFCEQAADLAEESGCGAELLARLQCEERNTVCTTGELEVRCGAQLAAQDRCICEAYPSDPYCTGN